MSAISKIDKNFEIKTKIDKPDIVWYDAAEAPFRIHGAYSVNPYCRMNSDVAREIGTGVFQLHTNTAGIRCRFRCNSPYIAISVKWHAFNHMPHCTDLGISGFDLYSISDAGEYRAVKPFFTPWDISGANDGYDSLIDVKGEMLDYVINFPSYNDVDRLFIGVAKDTTFEEPGNYKNSLPVVFYGSSITQGGCASRPGNIYQNFLTRFLNIDYINLGFSGNGQAQPPMVEYLSNLDMCVFVSDYDHNAPSPDHLRKTHYKLYESIRTKKPDIPYIMISKPDYKFDNPRDVERKEIIKESYRRAVESGDKNVYFLDGESIFGDFERDAHTVDGCHPNDLGFYKFALALKPILEKLV